MSKTMISKDLLELAVGDVIVDLQGQRNAVTKIEDDYVDPDDGDRGWRVFTDTYPEGRGIFPSDGCPEHVKFAVEVERDA